MNNQVVVRIEDEGGGERWVPAEVLSWSEGPDGCEVLSWSETDHEWVAADVLSERPAVRWANVRYLDEQLGTFSEAEVR